MYEAVDAKRDEAEDNEQDNDNDGNDIVFLHDVWIFRTAASNAADFRFEKRW